jgi:DNA polymerase-3 subunit alpha
VIEYLPLHRPTGSVQDSPIKTVTQFSMSIIDNQGLLKVDFLGLSTLTVMARACDLICERHGVDFNLDNIPLDDSETFELLGRGETAGVFQVEGSGMRRNLMEMKPKSLDHVIAMVALFRPGPMDFIPDYIARMHEEQEIEYLHPKLEPILEETYGITVYQEQIMYTAMDLANYTASEADFLRKTVAKKKETELLKQRDRFVGGAVENDVPVEIANQIFDQWEAFARYGFPKGHAADYGVIAVQTAYLKTHYPVEYMAALLAVEQNNTDKVALYVADCRRMGIEVLPPDINKSGWDFTIEDYDDGKSSIRFGLGAVKNVGHGPVDVVLEARQEGSFEDLNEFVRRVDLRKVGKRALECLIKVGALSVFGPRTALLDSMDQIMSISASHFRAVDSGQMSLFGPQTGLLEKIELPATGMEVSRREQLNWERDLIGLYVSDHPLSPVMDAIRDNITHSAAELLEAQNQQKVRVAGLITRIRPHTTKKGAAMAFATIEDFQGAIDLVIFPRTYAKYRELVEWDNIVLVDGKVDSRGAEPKVLVDHFTTEFDHVAPLEDQGRTRSKRQQRDAGLQLKPKALPATPDGERDPTQGPRGETETDAASGWDAERVPPPPEVFPYGWEEANGLALEPAPSKNPPEPAEEASEQEQHSSQSATEMDLDLDPNGDSQADEAVDRPEADTELPSPTSSSPALSEEIESPEAVLPQPEVAGKILQPLVPPLRPGTTDDIHMVTVILRPHQDKARDKLLLRRIFGLLICHPGEDRFAFHIFEHGKGHLLEFPNLTTGLCPELIDQITKLVGAENIRIEPITFQ